jgi:hypothetical protein
VQTQTITNTMAATAHGSLISESLIVIFALFQFDRRTRGPAAMSPETLVGLAAMARARRYSFGS